MVHGPAPAAFYPFTLKYQSPAVSGAAGVTEHVPVPEGHPAAVAVYQADCAVEAPVPTRADTSPPRPCVGVPRLAELIRSAHRGGAVRGRVDRHHEVVTEHAPEIVAEPDRAQPVADRGVGVPPESDPRRVQGVGGPQVGDFVPEHVGERDLAA